MIHFHKWSKWDTGRFVSRSVLSTVMEKNSWADLQHRTCKKCGLIQTRSV